MIKITVLDNERRRDRFEVHIGSREILCSNISQVCRRIKELCPNLPKSPGIPADVQSDMFQDAEKQRVQRQAEKDAILQEPVVHKQSLEEAAMFIGTRLDQIKGKRGAEIDSSVHESINT